MKKLVNLFNNKVVLAIDPATHSIAFGAMERSGDEVKLLGSGKVNFKGCKTPDEKFARINSVVPLLIHTFTPDMLVIEQPIYIQNFQTSRDISYIVGYTWGKFCQEGVSGIDIGPMQWKSAIGYKKVSAAEKKIWGGTMTATEVKKKAEYERKNRVKDILSKVFTEIEDMDDTDVVDAIGIAYWAMHNA
jgi:Holliday junction resolvasome RuvABC endonuclease subunit